MTLSSLVSGCQSKKATSAKNTISTSQQAHLRVKPLQNRPAPAWHQYQKHVQIPILMYHSIASGNPLKVPADQFHSEMRYLHDHHYYTLTTAEAIRAFKTNQLPQKKVVWITFDDAYRNNETKGLPILRDYRLHATINYITGFSQRPTHLSLAATQRMRASGLVEFESHTVQHLDLNELTDSQQAKELNDSKKWLDQHLHQKTTMICYPAGRANQDTAKLAKKAGYQIGLTTQPGMGSVHQQGWYNLKRQRVVPGMSTADFASLLTNNPDSSK